MHERNIESVPCISEADFRIVDQYGLNSDNFGLLLYNGGTVCDDIFDQNAANAICSLLGYAASGSSWISEYRWYQQNQYSITLGDVNCPTSSWSTCTYSESPNCRHSEDVFLICLTRVQGKAVTDPNYNFCFGMIRIYSTVHASCKFMAITKNRAAPGAVVKEAFFDILILNRTKSVEMIITLFQEMTLCQLTFRASLIKSFLLMSITDITSI